MSRFEDRVNFDKLYNDEDESDRYCDECGAAKPDFITGTTVNADPEPEMVTKDYLVTATIQMVIPSEVEAWALLEMKDRLHALIDRSEYRHDPLNGAIITGVKEITSGE